MGLLFRSDVVNLVHSDFGHSEIIWEKKSVLTFTFSHLADTLFQSD